MREPKTHDYTIRVWGHSYNVINVIDEGIELDMFVFSDTILRDGDYMIMTNSAPPPGKNDTTRYQIVTRERMVDPMDMYRVRARFAPREERQ